MTSHLLFHICHIENLESILLSGGLLSYSKIQKQDVNYTNIAHNGLQSRRSTTLIPVKPNGFLHDYVPFYFSACSPMLYAIKKKRVEGFSGKQNDIIYFVSSTVKITSSDLKFIFTDGHAIMAYTEFFNDIKDLEKIDWEIMKERYWNDTINDPDRKRRRQAEFLVHQFVDLDHFLGIGVKTAGMKDQVEDLLRKYNVDLTVLVRPQFYF